MENLRCPRSYLRTPSEIIWGMNDISINTITVDDGTPAGKKVYSLFFPRPWSIIGFTDMADTGAAPTYGKSYTYFLAPNTQADNSSAFIDIFLDFAFANTHEYDLDFYINNYVGPGPFANSINPLRDFRGYFTKYLNNDSLNAPEQWYNAIVQAESHIKTFADNNTAATAEDWFGLWQEMVNFLKTTINPNYMGAPGLYFIRQTGSGSGSPDWFSQNDYQVFLNA